MAEGPGRGNPPLKGYRILVNKLPHPAAPEPVPRGRDRADAPLAAFAFFAQPDRMRAAKEERTP